MSPRVKLEAALLRTQRRPRLEHRPSGGVGVTEKTRAAHQKNGVRQLVQHEVGRGELGGGPLLGESKPERGAEVAGETLSLSQIGRVEIAARFVADATRTAVASFSNKAGAASRYESAAARTSRHRVRSASTRVCEPHLIAQRPLANGDLLRNPVAGRETPIGRVQASVDPEIAEAAKFMGLHVLDAEPTPRPAPVRRLSPARRSTRRRRRRRRRSV